MAQRSKRLRLTVYEKVSGRKLDETGGKARSLGSIAEMILTRDWKGSVGNSVRPDLARDLAMGMSLEGFGPNSYMQGKFGGSSKSDVVVVNGRNCKW